MNRDVARAIVPGSGAFIALIAAMMTMTAMTIDINLPAIPVTAADLGTSLTMAQLTVTVFFGGFAVGQLLWGSLSDRIGRKPGILIGTVLYEIATRRLRAGAGHRDAADAARDPGHRRRRRRGARPGHHPRPVRGRRRWRGSCRW